MVQLALQPARGTHAEALAQQQALGLGAAVADRQVDLGIALVVFEHRLQFLDQAVGEHRCVDLDLEGALGSAGDRRRRGDLLGVGFEALGLLHDQLRLSAVLVVEAAADEDDRVGRDHLRRSPPGRP